MSSFSGLYVILLKVLGLGDLPKVGGKNVSLGEMIKNLSSRKIRIPYGFAVTVDAFDAFIE